ncbi:MAG: 2-oxo-4-hydroxy-4-carboxy-5-ureidoimidazoline decarboxylase [Ferruginibacter sp.]|nr:2-oxo-4-hydroxy-4-carboxy-5-ureidoimidazoline decarboxylase [Ferruginibacter sp.]
MTLHELNILPTESLKQELFKCCGSANWVNKMLPFFPADDLVEILEDAEEQWYACTEEDWKEAFTHHPKIGDVDSLEKKFAATAQWASGEQATVNTASRDIISDLAAANESYEKKFGYIFIVCATGKTAEEMLTLLRQRLSNGPEEEIKIAMDEQNKITLLRLQKLVL